MNLQLSRKEFLLSVATGVAAAHAEPAKPVRAPKALIVVAHPDDEYACAATVYRITHEFAGTVDQVVLTNGEGGYRYSQLAEAVYGEPLTVETVGRAALPAIRKAETARAGRLLGVRNQWFLEQKDARFTLDGNEAFRGLWDTAQIERALLEALENERYDLVFTLLPTEDTHGHHQAATLLLLEAVGRLSEDERPAVFGARAAVRGEAGYRFHNRIAYPLTATTSEAPLYSVRRTDKVRQDCPLTYEIIVNWVVAEYKSQGLLQAEAGKHDREQFWLFRESGPSSALFADQLFGTLSASATAL